MFTSLIPKFNEYLTESVDELLAPNGKPSNLSPELYKYVRSLRFISWFGDWINSPESASKVVDDNGEPLLVGHGTKERFDKFNRKFSMQGVFWFSSDLNKIKNQESGANSSKVVMECFLKGNKIAGWEEYEKYGLGQIHQMGYDIIKLDDDYVVYDNKQIKIIK